MMEKAQAERFVEAMAAMNAQRPCEVRRTAANWEDGLSEFEWIEFWASLYCSESTESSNQAAIKH